MSGEPARLLTIGGSDSGGAAGIQADLKTWTALGVYGMSAITAVTAQNSVQVSAVHYLPAAFVAAQIDAVLSDYGAQAVKTGFIGEAGLIKTVARALDGFDLPYLIVDPVLVNHLGQPMFGQAVVQAYRSRLLPQADLLTPNWREAALLADLAVGDIGDRRSVRQIVDRLHLLGARKLLLTGIGEAEEMVDYWSDGTSLHRLAMPRIETENRHGSGDTLSAAICAFLARGEGMEEAIIKAQAYTANALRAAAQWKLGQGHGPLSHIEWRVTREEEINRHE